MTPQGSYFLDGIDLWNTYGIGISSGSDAFLKLPKRKETTAVNWGDQNGIDIDLSRTFVEARDITLDCFLIAPNVDEFWIRYNAFFTKMTAPGLRRLAVTSHGREYGVFYKESPSYQTVAPLKYGKKVYIKFSIVITEKDPSQTSQTFLTDETDKFIIL